MADETLPQVGKERDPGSKLLPATATFKARRVPTLAAFLPPPTDDRDIRFGGVQIAPAADGGATLFATDGRVAVLITDPGGHASAPLTLDLPPELVAACTPGKAPPLYDVNGERLDFDLPPWFTPGRLEIVADCGQWVDGRQRALVLVGVQELPEDLKEQTRCGDGAGLYVGHSRVRQRPIINFESVFAREVVLTGRLLVDPELLARAAATLGPAVDLSLGGERGAVLLEPTERSMAEWFGAPGCSIQAAIMPMAARDSEQGDPARESSPCSFPPAPAASGPGEGGRP